MAVVYAKETHVGRDGNRTTDGGRLVRMFVVVTSSRGDGPVNVMAATPSLYTTYSNGTESAAFWVLKNKTPIQNSASPLVWEVRCEYEPMSREGDDEPNPISRPPRVRWVTGQESGEIVKDAYGINVANTAGEPFDEPTEADRAFDILTIERYESSYDPAVARTYKNTLNQTPMFGYAAKEGRMVSIDAESEIDPDYGVIAKVTYEIHFRVSDVGVWVPNITSAQLILQDGSAAPSGGPWDTYRRNVGTRPKKSSAGDAVRNQAIDEKGMSLAEPVDLASNGTKLTMSDFNSTGAFYILFRHYKPKSWLPLNLPTA